MEQIFTIPVNEAFEVCANDHSLGCPFCRLYNKLESEELNLILGASMMEPEIREKTNKEGFCPEHFSMMLRRPKKLPMALIMESHLISVRESLKGYSLMAKNTASADIKTMNKLSSSCYVCKRLDTNFNNVVETAAYLWDKDSDFRKKCELQPFFCIPHFSSFVEKAMSRLQRKEFSTFLKSVSEIQERYFEELSEDVSFFCKKFDYRYTDEPWGNSKDSVERAVWFLSSKIHTDETDTPEASGGLN